MARTRLSDLYIGRTRIIRPDDWRDEEVATMSIAARLVFVYLPCYADDTGFLFEHPDELKRLILPRHDVDMVALLAEIAGSGRIRRYTDAAGRACIQFTPWNQPVHNDYGSLWPNARRAAKERDGHQCVNCQATERLEVHHIRPLRLFGEDFAAGHAIANLVTLCKPCHGRADADFRRKEREA